MTHIIIFRARGDSLQRLPIEASTLDEATLKTAHGVYTVFRVYPGRRVLRFDQHLARMRHSAELLNLPYPVTDVWLRAVTRRAVLDSEQLGVESPRVRLTVPFDTPNSALIAVEAFALPPADIYEQGVRAGLVNTTRDQPLAKSTHFIELRRRLEAEHPGQFYELLLVDDDGYILEGAGSNFYAVLDGELRTAEAGMLEGIARSILLEVATDVLPVRFDPIHCDDLPHLSEAMLTSASRGVVPIVQIGDTVINGTQPGPVYQELRNAYEAVVEKELKPL